MYQIHKVPQNGFIPATCPQLHLDNGHIMYTKHLVNGGYSASTRAYFVCNENDGYALGVHTSGLNYTDCQYGGAWTLAECISCILLTWLIDCQNWKEHWKTPV